MSKRTKRKLIELSPHFKCWVLKRYLSWLDINGGLHGQNYYFTPELMTYGLDGPPIETPKKETN